jgi:gluconokinase
MSSTLDEIVEGADPVTDILSVLSELRPAVLLSLDIGTSGVRVSLFNEFGEELVGGQATSRRRSESFSAFGQLDPDQLVNLVIETIDDLFENPVYRLSRIKHVSISCFWHSMMGIDASDKATTALFTWADTRAAQSAQELKDKFEERELHMRTGCRFHPSYWPAKLLWLRKVQPVAFEQTVRWVGLSEYLTLRLFGDSSASVSMASATGLLNQTTCDWEWSLVDALDISRDALPLIRDDDARSDLRPEFRDRWPALAGAELVTIVGDGAANNIGGGCSNSSRCALMVGTSGAMRVVLDNAPPISLSPALWSYRVDRKRVIVGGALSDGGGLYSWLTDLMLLNDRASLEQELAALEPDAHGLTLLPFWSGERSSGWSTAARGGIFGFTQETKPVEIVRAALEAISYRFAVISKALDEIAPSATIVATGNALRSSPVWQQILSDVLGRSLLYGGSPEASIRGAALLALESAGKIATIEEVTVVGEWRVEPDMDRHAVYQRGLSRQEDLYKRLIK